MIFDERFEEMKKEKLEQLFCVDDQAYKNANLFYFEGDSLGQDGKKILTDHVNRLTEVLSSEYLSKIYSDGQHPLTYSDIQTQDKHQRLTSLLNSVGGLGVVDFDGSFSPYKNIAIETNMDLLRFSKEVLADTDYEVELLGKDDQGKVRNKIKTTKTVFWVVEHDGLWSRCIEEEDYINSINYNRDKHGLTDEMFRQADEELGIEIHEPFYPNENGLFKRYSLTIMDNQADFIHWNSETDFLDPMMQDMMDSLNVSQVALPLWGYRFDIYQNREDYTISFEDVFPRLSGRNWGEHCRMTLLGRIFASNAIVQSFRCFSILNCSNVETDVVRPPSKLQKKRKKRNRPPLKTYKTLKLTGTKSSKGNGKGNGIDKALHLCRGHFKNYTEDNPLFGKYTGRYWWQPQVRGKKEAGEGIKDYQKELDDKKK